LTEKCEQCGAYNFEVERVGADRHFTICCQNGKISPTQLRHFAPPPPALQEILSGRTGKMRRAKDLLKQYNNAFAFVSYGMHCFNEVQKGHGPPVTICHGTVYHQSGFLFPGETETGNFAQVYLYDSNEAMETRQANPFNKEPDEEVLRTLQEMMDQVPPYVQHYRKMVEVARTQLPLYPPETKLAIAHTPGTDMRRYNKPKLYGPAVVFYEKWDCPFESRHCSVAA